MNSATKYTSNPKPPNPPQKATAPPGDDKMLAERQGRGNGNQQYRGQTITYTSLVVPYYTDSLMVSWFLIMKAPT